MKEVSNICRPFILYNDFLPPVSKPHDDWQYMSFGYYDGVSVGENLFKDKEWCLKKLWDYDLCQGNDMNGGYSYRILWGIRSESSDLPESELGNCKDEEFWDESERKKYPFLFISLLQMEKPFQSNIGERKKLEEQLADVPNIKAITYLTLDNSDMILVLRCKSYSAGAKIINDFHYGINGNGEYAVFDQSWKLSYSFTVASIDKKVLSDNDAIEKLKENISYAYIYAIQKQPGGISCIREELEKIEKLEENQQENYVDHSSAVLGCNDEVIVLKDIPWCEFLKLFQDETGILNHTNSTYRQKLIGVTTIIGKEQTGKPPKSPEGTASETRKETLLSQIVREKCRNELKLEDSVQTDAVKRGVHQVANALHKFEKTPFADYLFQSVLMPLNMMIDMANSDVQISKENYYSSFYEFMKGVNLYAQNSGHTDRQFTQTPNMNIRIYDTPVKLNAFYNAFIYYLKTYLNSFRNEEKEGEKHEYEFLACPGVTNNMQVQELFKQISDTKRLFLVEIPENQIYSPKMMMVMLAHEVSHFVGTGVRNREKRLECAEQILSKIIIKYVRAQVKQYIIGRNETSGEREFRFIDNEKFWKKAEADIANKISTFAGNYRSYLENKKFSGMTEEQRKLLATIEKRKYHSELLRGYMMDAATNVLLNNEQWRYLSERDFLFWLDEGASVAEDKKNQLNEQIWSISSGFLTYDLWNAEALSVITVVDKMIYLLKECFADLMAILTLRLTMADYLDAILQGNEGKDILKKDVVSGLDIRSGLVTCCMCYVGNKNMGYTWNNDELKKITASNDQELQKLRTRILNFKEDYLDQKASKCYDDAKANRAIDILADTDILAVIMKYLLICKKTFAENTLGSKLQYDLVKIYNSFSEMNLEKLTAMIQEYVTKYLDEIKAKNSACAKRGDESELV